MFPRRNALQPPLLCMVSGLPEAGVGGLGWGPLVCSQRVDENPRGSQPRELQRRRDRRRAFELSIPIGLFCACHLVCSAASLPTYDGLDYAAGFDLGTQADTPNTSIFQWTKTGTTVSGQTTTIKVASGSLTYPGLTNSVGNSITNPPAPSQGLRYESGGTNVYSSGIFYSALIKINSLGALGTSGDYVMALNNTSTTNQSSNPTTLAARLWVRRSPSDSAKFNVGVSYGSGTVTPTWDGTDRGPGTTVFVVVRYLSSGGLTNATMWVNPAGSDLGAASPPAGSVTNSSGSNPGTTIQSLLVVNQTATTPPYTIDEVRIGATWASVTTPGAPGITTQPVNTTSDAGQNPTLSVAAVGASVGGALAYQWQKNNAALTDGGNISGANTPSLSLSSVLQGDEGTYKVTVTNNFGATDSAAVTLTVNDPEFISQPAVSNPTPLPGSTVSFTNAAAIGTPSLSYRWQKDGADVNNGTFGGASISGAYTPTLTIAGVRAGVLGDSGSYVLRVTNGLGRAVNSSPVVLAVSDPIFVSNPASAARNFNDSVTFSATISGSAPPFTYQWKKNGAQINNGDLGGRAHVSPLGASPNTTTTLTIDNLIASDAANSPGYSALVTDTNSSSAVSSAATLSVADPQISTPVANVVSNAGATARLKVQAAGSGILSYIWRTNEVAVANGPTPWGSTISGADTDTLLIANVTPTDARTYTVEVNGAGPAQASSGSLSVAQISKQPAPGSQTVVVGSRTVFSVAASLTGPGSLTYQWVHGNGSPYAGQTSTTFRIDSTQSTDADSGIQVKVYYTSTDYILSDPVSLTVSADNRLLPGNLIVLRGGDGSQSLTNGGSFPTSIYFDQFDTSGNYVSTVSVPDSGADAAVTTANVAALPPGSALNGTSLQRSADGRRLVFSCYNTNVGFAASLSGASAAAVPRCAGTLGPLGEYSLLKDTAFTNTTYRAAVFDGTNDFWEAGTTASTGNAINGVFYVGSVSPSSTAISTASGAGAANVRYAQFFNVNGQFRLYFDSANTPAGLYHIDGFPKTGGSSVVTDLVLAVNTGGPGAPGATAFAVSPDGNTVYMADGRNWSTTVTNTTGGIQKWTNGVLDKVLRPDPATTVGAMYLAVDFAADPVVIYVVTTAFTSTMDRNEVAKVVDDGSPSGVATVLRTAGANQSFRGISFGPAAVPITLVCSSNRLVECGSAWDFDPPAFTNSCSGTNVTLTVLGTVTNSAGHCAGTFDARRTWQVTDACSNSATCSQTVTTVDTTPPLIVCASNKVAEFSSNWSFDPPSASDACCGTNVTISVLSTVTNGPGCSPSIMRTWQATDCCSNSATCSQTVTLQDTTLAASAGPSFSACIGSRVLIGGSPTATGGTPPYTYLWSPSDHLTSTSVANPNADVYGAITYTVTVTDAKGCTAGSSMSISPLAQTTASAVSSLTNCPGTSASFSTTAAGTGPFAYQWTKNGALISGATDSAYAVASVASADAGAYCAVVAGACNSVTNCAVLTVSSCTVTGSPVAPSLIGDLKLSRAGTISAMAFQDDGRILIGGSFTAVNGVRLANMARIDVHGAVDPTWAPNPDGAVNNLVVTGALVFASGAFQNIGGQSRNGLALLSTTNAGGADALWNPSPTGAVYALALSGTNLFVGGNFNGIGGSSESFLAKLSTSGAGAADASWNPGANGEVDALAGTGSDLYIGGQFTFIGGEPRYRLARLPVAGPATADPSWTPGVDAGFIGCCGPGVSRLALSDTDLVFSGSFSNVAGVARHDLAKVALATGALDLNWNPYTDSAAANFTALAVSGANVFVGGAFISIGGQTVTNLASLSLTGSGAADTNWTPNVSFPDPTASVGALLLGDTWMYAGGSFVAVNGTTSIGLGKLDQATAIRDDQFLAQISGPPGSVYALARQADGKVIVGGDFWLAGFAPRWNLARVNADGSLDNSWAPLADGQVLALVPDDTNVFAGGAFNTINGQSSHGLAKMDTSISGAVDATFVPPVCCGSVDALGLDSGNLYVGGQFSLSNQIPLALARLSAATGAADSGWSLTSAGGGVAALALGGGNLFVAGGFSNLAEQPITGVARLSTSGNGTVDTSWNANVTGPAASVAALSLSGADLYIGGAFDSVGGQNRRGLAKVSASGNGAVDLLWDPIGSAGGGAGGFARVSSLALNGTNLYVAGFFGSVPFTNAIQYLARFSLADAGPLDTAWHPNPAGFATAQTGSAGPRLALLPNGANLYIGGDFQAVGGEVSGTGALARSSFALLAVADAPVLIKNGATTFQVLRNPADGVEVGYFQITGITGGTLYLSDGVTEVHVGDLITAEQGSAGLVLSGPTATVTAVSAVNNTSVVSSFVPGSLDLGAPQPAVFSFSAPAYSVDENAGSVTLTVLKRGSGSGSVNYTTANGSAIGGANYTATSGLLSFASSDTSKAITIPILDDGSVNGNKTFTVTFSGAVLAYPAAATVTISETDHLIIAPLGGNVSPSSPLPANGFLTVQIQGAAGAWRLLGEHDWRAGGTSVGGLIAGEYRVEFQPVPGFTADDAIVQVRSGVLSEITKVYRISGNGPLAGAGNGGLSALIFPVDVANATELTNRGQWRVQNSATDWLDSGYVMTDIPAGYYTIEFKPVMNQVAPPPESVRVASNAGFVATALYRLATEASGAPPVALDFSQITTDSRYQYVGQVSSDSGVGSGVVVTRTAVLTAERLLFDEVLLRATLQPAWTFQLDPQYRSPALIARFWIASDGYASQRRPAYQPGVLDYSSGSFGIAALYFDNSTDLAKRPGRGGYSPPLVSDASNNYLTSSAPKTVVGYPGYAIEGISPTDQNRLFATPTTNVALSRPYAQMDANSSVYATTDVRGYAGMTGGPLSVQDSLGQYRPAGIYLGPSQDGQLLVRAIDQSVAWLIANIDDFGHASGGNIGVVNLWAFGQSLPSTYGGLVQISLASGSLPSGAQWYLGPGDGTWYGPEDRKLPGVPGFTNRGYAFFQQVVPVFYVHFADVPCMTTPPDMQFFTQSKANGFYTNVARYQSALTVTVTPNPATVCSGSSATLTATVSGSSATPFTYSWNGPSGSLPGGLSSISASDAGTYTVFVTDNSSSHCTAAASATLTVNPSPAVNINSGANAAVICAGSSTNLTASTSAANPSYLWNPGGATTALVTVSPAATTSYTVTVNDGVTGCASSASRTVTVNQPPTVNINSGTTPAVICVGSSTNLTASTSASSPTYLWTPGGATTATNTVSPAATTNYTVTVIDGLTGCASSASRTVTVNQPPTVSINSGATPAVICAGSSTNLTASTSASSPTYLWTPGGATTATNAVSPAATTNYTVTVTDGLTGCASSASRIILINVHPTSVVSGSTTICAGGSATLSAALTGTPPWNLAWSDGAQQNAITSSPATRSVSPGLTTTYTLSSLTDAHCAAQSSDRTGSASVTVMPAPTAWLAFVLNEGLYIGVSANSTWQIQSSGDLQHWGNVGTSYSLDASGQPQLIPGTASIGNGQNFYRAVWQRPTPCP